LRPLLERAGAILARNLTLEEKPARTHAEAAADDARAEEAVAR